VCNAGLPVALKAVGPQRNIFLQGARVWTNGTHMVHCGATVAPPTLS